MQPERRNKNRENKSALCEAIVCCSFQLARDRQKEKGERVTVEREEEEKVFSVPLVWVCEEI